MPARSSKNRPALVTDNLAERWATCEEFELPKLWSNDTPSDSYSDS